MKTPNKTKVDLTLEINTELLDTQLTHCAERALNGLTMYAGLMRILEAIKDKIALDFERNQIHVPLTPKDEAEAAGFRALTKGYALPRERELFDRVRFDLASLGTTAVYVDGGQGIEIWRYGVSPLNTDTDN